MDNSSYILTLALFMIEEFEEMLFGPTANDDELKLYLEESLDEFSQASPNVPMNKAHVFMAKFISKALWPVVGLDLIEKVLWLEAVRESLPQEIDNYLSKEGEIYRNTLGCLHFTVY